MWSLLFGIILDNASVLLLSEAHSLFCVALSGLLLAPYALARTSKYTWISYCSNNMDIIRSGTEDAHSCCWNGYAVAVKKEKIDRRISFF